MSCNNCNLYLDLYVTITCFPCQDTVCCNGQLEIQEMKSSNGLDDGTKKWGWLQPWQIINTNVWKSIIMPVYVCIWTSRHVVVTSTKSGLALAMYSPACSWTGKQCVVSKSIETSPEYILWLSWVLKAPWIVIFSSTLVYFCEGIVRELRRYIQKNEPTNPTCHNALSLRIPSPQCPPPMVKSCRWDERKFKTNKTPANSSAIKWPRITGSQSLSFM